MTQIDSRAHWHGAGIVQCFLGRGIGQCEPVVEELDASHAFNSDQTTIGTLRVLMKRIDCFGESFEGMSNSPSSRICTLQVFLRYIFKANKMEFLLYAQYASCSQ